MLFSDHLRKLAQPIWSAQLTHPFVVALGKGTLPEHKFKSTSCKTPDFSAISPVCFLPER